MAAEALFPFVMAPLAQPDDAVNALFRKSFGCAAPREPLHFVARPRSTMGPVAGYVHYIPYRPGVFLCGGLCVDPSVYRTLAPEQRRAVAGAGSLSRWLLVHSIAALPDKQAVFAFTGDTRSRRDVAAAGFMPALPPHLFVHWHGVPVAQRQAMIADVAALGPF